MTGRFGRILGIAALVLAAAYVLWQDQQPPPPGPDAPRPPVTNQQTLPLGTGFDFYVLSLSWSPSYCEAEGADANRQQCESGRPYAFVVHGLWPQFERGFPESCATDEPKVSDAALRGLYDLMPSAGLIRHQWNKHGSCSGLAQDDYFATLRAARQRTAIPAAYERLESYVTVAPGALEQSFLEANPGMPADGIAVTCDQRFIREVRICLSRDLSPRSCPEVDRRACRAAKAIMPPVRGG